MLLSVAKLFFALQEFWKGHIDAIKEGLCVSSRLQKYISKVLHSPLSESVGDHVLEQLFSGQSLEEQQRVFQSMPLGKVEAVVR